VNSGLAIFNLGLFFNNLYIVAQPNVYSDGLSDKEIALLMPIDDAVINGL